MLRAPLCRSFETQKDDCIARQAGINEDIEQRRRLLDEEGEKQRIWVANKTAQLLKFTPCELKHVPYPVQAALCARRGTEVAKEVKPESAEHGAVSVLYKASHFAGDTFHLAADAVSTAGHKAAALSHKAVEVAASVGEKTIEAANAVGDAVVEVAGAVGHVTAEVASTLEHKTAEARHKAADIAHAVGHKTADVAHAVSHKTADVAALAAEIAHEARNRLVHLKDEVVYTTTRKYVRAQMESERRRRETDVDEQYAILNALRVSSLIKDLGCEFYRQHGQNFTYSFKLLEETERVWQEASLHSVVASANARKVALLVKGKYFPISHTEKAYTSGKVEIVEDNMPARQVFTQAF
jgi:uncharacterized protein YoxC